LTLKQTKGIQSKEYQAQRTALGMVE